MAAYEDDRTTGHFCAIDTTQVENPIVDALHVHIAADMTDRDVPSKLRIVWSRDGHKAVFLINDYPHAAFDFEAKRGYCQTGFPPPSEDWSTPSHGWNNAALSLSGQEELRKKPNLGTSIEGHLISFARSSAMRLQSVENELAA